MYYHPDEAGHARVWEVDGPSKGNVTKCPLLRNLNAIQIRQKFTTSRDSFLDTQIIQGGHFRRLPQSSTRLNRRVENCPSLAALWRGGCSKPTSRSWSPFRRSSPCWRGMAGFKPPTRYHLLKDLYREHINGRGYHTRSE